MLFSSAGSVYAQNTKINLVCVEYSTSGLVSPDGANNISVSLVADVIPENSTFEIAFLPAKNVVDYYFVGNGISALSQVSKSGELTYCLQADGNYGEFILYVDFGNGEYLKQSIYTYTDASVGKTFISTTGEDTAWFMSLRYKYDSDLITLAEMDYERSVYNQKYLIYSNNIGSQGGTISRVSNSMFTVHGTLDTILWSVSNPGVSGVVLKPLKFAKVELYDYADYYNYYAAPMGTTYTNANGYYSFVYEEDDNYDSQVFIRVYPESTTFKVQNIGGYNDYRMDSYSVYIGTWSGSAQEISFSISAVTSGSDASHAYYVFQGMVVGQRYALDMGMSVPTNKLPIVFPASTSPINVSRTNFLITYNSITRIIASTTPVSIEIVPNDWYTWDTFSHEYGHFVRIYKGLVVGNIFPISSPSGHFINTDHFYDGIAATCGKAYAMEFTWEEAWASAFSQIAQDKYKSEYVTGSTMFSVAYASDYKITLSGGWESPGVNTSFYYSSASNEAQEMSVIAFLWDVSQYINYQNFWNSTTISGIRTLTDFANYLDTQYPQYRGTIGQYLGLRQIAPSSFRITNTPSTTTPPTFSWKINGSSNISGGMYYYPNNVFEICFYNSSNTLVHTIGPIALASSQPNTYIMPYTSMTTGEWNTILAKFSNNYSTALAKVTVRGYLTTISPASGPYTSAYATY